MTTFLSNLTKEEISVLEKFITAFKSEIKHKRKDNLRTISIRHVHLVEQERRILPNRYFIYMDHNDYWFAIPKRLWKITNENTVK